jgi:hypothetical protein
MEVVTAASVDKTSMDVQRQQEEDSKLPAIDATTSVAGPTGSAAAGASTTTVAGDAAGDRSLLSASLFRMTDGIPKRELKLIITEAEECQKALQEELDMLKKALEVEQQRKKNDAAAASAAAATASGVGPNDDNAFTMDDETEAAVTSMLESESTPPDQFWTLSALLGRLRHDLTTPLPPHSQISVAREQNGLGPLEAQLARKIPPYLKKKRGSLLNSQSLGGTGSGATTPVSGSGRSTPVAVSFASGGGGGGGSSSSSVEISQFQRLLDIDEHPLYTREHENPDMTLMSLWKKISMHKSSLVFRKPVNPKEAPGYTDRIMFPMDLSVMRKLIMARTIRSYKDFSQRIALICHNCVKYNGRESDYALVAREFESVCSEFIWIAVQDEIAEGATAAAMTFSLSASVPQPTTIETITEKEISNATNPDPSAAAAPATATSVTATAAVTAASIGAASNKTIERNEDDIKKRKLVEEDVEEPEGRKESKASKTD